MGAFFTPPELAAQLQRDDIAASTAELFAVLASDTIRDELRQLIDPVVSETITVYGDGGEVLVLPERPVTAVSSIMMAGQAVSPFDWRPNGTVRRVVFPGSFFAGETWYVWPFGLPVTVTYSHGYTTVPNTIKAVALELAASAYINPSVVTSETVGGYSVTYGRSIRSAMELTDEQRRRLDKYRLVDM